MLLEIRPISGNRKDLESVVTEIALHLRCIDSMRPPGIKCVLNLGDISFVPNRPAPLTKPVLHHHGDTGGAAPVLFLRNEWNVEPDTGRVCGHQDSADPNHNPRLEDAAEHADRPQRTATMIRTSATTARMIRIKSRSLKLPAAKSAWSFCTREASCASSASSSLATAPFTCSASIRADFIACCAWAEEKNSRTLAMFCCLACVAAMAA